MYEQHITTQQIPQWKYLVFAEMGFQADLGEFPTYGIATSNYEVLIHDVSVDETIADWMVDLFNRHQLSPVQLKEVVEDLLP